MNISDIAFATYGRSAVQDRVFPRRPNGINKLYYINDGAIDCKMPSGCKRLERGHLYLIPNGVQISLETERADHTFFDFYTLPVIVNSSIIDIDPRDYPLIESALHTLNLFVGKYPMRTVKKRNAHYEFVRSSLVNLLFLIGEEYEILTLKDQVIDRAIAYINRHYADPLSVSELAASFHIAEGTFIRRFKRYTSMTPYQYIKLRRVNMAIALLSERNRTLEEVAAVVGYADAPTLSHAIKASGYQEK